jgi:hypothetical protein
MSKSKIILQFPDLYQLWSFSQQLTEHNLEINSSKKTLVCHCTEDEVVLASEKHGAISIGVVKQVK